MRYLLLTDIHANLEGLETCLKDARVRGYDETLVLGDIVGYGPDPNAVIQTIRALNPKAIVRGNHDKVALGMNQAEGFHAAARAAAHWMLESLTHENREWLVALPMGPILIDGEIEICHGSPFDEDAYIFDELDARHAFEAASAPVCFYGHTHFAVVFRMVKDLARDCRPARRRDRADHRSAVTLPRESRVGWATARRRPACRLRHLRHRREAARFDSPRVSARNHAGKDAEGGIARSACAAAGAGTLAKS